MSSAPIARSTTALVGCLRNPSSPVRSPGPRYSFSSSASTSIGNSWYPHGAQPFSACCLPSRPHGSARRALLACWCPKRSRDHALERVMNLPDVYGTVRTVMIRRTGEETPPSLPDGEQLDMPAIGPDAERLTQADDQVSRSNGDLTRTAVQRLAVRSGSRPPSTRIW